MIASATKFESKGIIQHFIFLRMTGSVIAQAKASSGLVFIKANPFNLRTLTVWEGEESMKNFRNSGAHLEAMKASKKLGVAWSSTWTTTQIPTWRESIERINEKVRMAKNV